MLRDIWATCDTQAIEIRPVGVGQEFTSLKMLVGVVRGWPRVLGDETTAPTRGASVLANIVSRSELATFNKYERRRGSRRPRGCSIVAFSRLNISPRAHTSAPE